MVTFENAGQIKPLADRMLEIEKSRKRKQPGPSRSKREPRFRPCGCT